MLSLLGPVLAVFLVLLVLVGVPALAGWYVQHARHRASVAAVEAYHAGEHPTMALEPGYLNEEEATEARVDAVERSAFAEGTRALVHALDRREEMTRRALDRVLDRALDSLGLTQAEIAFVRMSTGEFPVVHLA